MTLSCDISVIPKQQINPTLQTLRAEGLVVPVLIGLDSDVERLAECQAHREQPLPEILAKASSIDVEALFATRELHWREAHRHEVEGILRHAAETPGSFSDDTGRAIIADYRRMLAASEFRVNRREDVLGQWPLKPLAAPDLTRELSSWSFKAWPEIGEIVEGPGARTIALVPVREDAHVFAFFSVGGWDDSPTPAEHVAVFRYWAARYDIELYQIDDRRWVASVAAPPETREEALELAWQQFFYCPSLLDHGPRNVSALAALLHNGLSWGFWWG